MTCGLLDPKRMSTICMIHMCGRRGEGKERIGRAGGSLSHKRELSLKIFHARSCNIPSFDIVYEWPLSSCDQHWFNQANVWYANQNWFCVVIFLENRACYSNTDNKAILILREIKWKQYVGGDDVICVCMYSIIVMRFYRSILLLGNFTNAV